MDRIVYGRPDGRVCIVVLKGTLGKTDEVSLRKRSDVPEDALSVCACDKANIPSDRSYRDAWERDTSRSLSPIKVNMPKAKAVHRNQLRQARMEKFIELDSKWMRAIATGDDTEAAEHESERQILRDLPQNPAIDAAKTSKELKAAWPADL